jgi:peptidyl-prolyl cis-trans isomerase B (cyclophilin B)
MKKLFLILLLAAAMAFTACGSDKYENEGENDMLQFPEDIQDNASDENRTFLDGTIYERLLDSPAVPLQLTPLTPGEELAVLHTNHGDITLRFFPEEAPLAVENFVTHARNGFYDGLIFHRVMPNFMIQGGCPHGTGRAGESIWGEGFGLERSFNLYHFRGALATAHAGPGTIGSQFYIVQMENLSADIQRHFEYLKTIQDEIAGEFSDGRHILVRELFPAEALEHFVEHGGTHWLDWHWNPQNYGHTVFGHVVSGLEVVDAIANVETHPEVVQGVERPGTIPVENVIIERISFKIYGE